jgi:SAM-dependent methyltransferase
MKMKQKPPKFYLWEKNKPYENAEDMKFGYGEGEYRFKQLAKFAHGKILEVGFGNRPNLYLKGDITGLDIVKKKTLPPNFKKMVVGDSQNMHMIKDKTFDCVVSGDMIEHLENPSNFLREAHRVLKDDGLLIVSTPNSSFLLSVLADILFLKHFYFNDTHINLFNPRIMYKLLRYNRFELKKMLSGGIYIPRTKYSIRLPATLSQHIVYIARKL